jgi:hypothetical protein
MSFPTARCKACGTQDIEITAGPTGKPLIECPTCGGQNVVEENQSQLTKYFDIMGPKSLTSKRSSKRTKKADIPLSPTPPVAIENVEISELPETNELIIENVENNDMKEDVVPEDFGEATESEPDVESKVANESKPKKRQKLSLPPAKKIPAKQQQTKMPPKPRQPRTRTSKPKLEPKLEPEQVKNSFYHCIPPTQCWKCDVELSSYIKFESDQLTQAFFCFECGVPQTFQCENCNFIHSLHFNYCVQCGQKPSCPTQEE